MKGKLLLLLYLLLLMSCLSHTRFSQTATIASSSSPVHNLNTGLNYTTIQDAIDANETLNGQTILVDDGTYYENVVVNKSLTLTGKSRDNTIVNANGTGEAFTLTVPNISLINFTAANSSMVGTPLYGNVFLNQTTDCTIKNVETLNSYTGVALLNSGQNVISCCELSANGVGIFLWNSDENTIRGNVASGNQFGITLWGENGSNDNVLDDNEASSNTYNGIDIVGINNNVNSNRLRSSRMGIVLDHANFTIVRGNEISNNTGYGVWLANGAMGNTFSGNTIEDNSFGIFGYSNTGNSSGDNNLFYENNVIGNGIQIAMTPNLSNLWDDGYPSGGNYWSDYKGTDVFGGANQNMSGSDGIGDSAYSVSPWNVTDSYPLMGPFSDFNATPEYHVQTISNSIISDFQFDGTAISFSASGENGTTGFCRICIPTALINGTFTVFVNGTEVPYTLLPESNITQSYLYFTYYHSTQQVIITPEFPSFLILSLFLIATLLTVIIYKKKGLKTSQS